jgi:hypothetical protein
MHRNSSYAFFLHFSKWRNFERTPPCYFVHLKSYEPKNSCCIFSNLKVLFQLYFDQTLGIKLDPKPWMVAVDLRHHSLLSLSLWTHLFKLDLMCMVLCLRATVSSLSWPSPTSSSIPSPRSSIPDPARVSELPQAPASTSNSRQRPGAPQGEPYHPSSTARVPSGLKPSHGDNER